jgi:hypothetical protein
MDRSVKRHWRMTAAFATVIALGLSLAGVAYLVCPGTPGKSKFMSSRVTLSSQGVGRLMFSTI